MWMSLPANLIPFDRYQRDLGMHSWFLPWYIWGGGVYATKYEYEPASKSGYRGAASVPLVGEHVRIRRIGVRGSVWGTTPNREGAFLRVRLWEQHGANSMWIAEIAVDRRTVPNAAIGDIHVNLSQNAGNFVASARRHSLCFDVMGMGQGLATVYALMVDLDY